MFFWAILGMFLFKKPNSPITHRSHNQRYLSPAHAARRERKTTPIPHSKSICYMKCHKSQSIRIEIRLSCRTHIGWHFILIGTHIGFGFSHTWLTFGHKNTPPKQILAPARARSMCAVLLGKWPSSRRDDSRMCRINYGTVRLCCDGRQIATHDHGVAFKCPIEAHAALGRTTRGIYSDSY